MTFVSFKKQSSVSSLKATNIGFISSVLSIYKQ